MSITGGLAVRLYAAYMEERLDEDFDGYMSQEQTFKNHRLWARRFLIMKFHLHSGSLPKTAHLYHPLIRSRRELNEQPGEQPSSWKILDVFIIDVPPEHSRNKLAGEGGIPREELPLRHAWVGAEGLGYMVGMEWGSFLRRGVVTTLFLTNFQLKLRTRW